MRRTRQILAIMVVATALCADRSLPMSAENAGAQPRATASLAGRVIERLSRGFCQTVPISLARDARVTGRSAEDRPAFLPTFIHEVGHVAVSPFQFRLPPPLC